MGQKVHPTGFRLGVIKKHNALWYAKGKSFRENLIEDLKVRNHMLGPRVDPRPSPPVMTPRSCLKRSMLKKSFDWISFWQ